MSEQSPSPRNERRHTVSDQAIEETILRLAEAAGAAGSISPNDAAKALAPEDWQSLMTRIRRTAIRLAGQGRITILRKGRPADPADFKGVYRLRIAAPPDRAD